jgi:hypothetical protein
LIEQDLRLDEYQKLAGKTRKELDQSVFYYGLGSESAGLLAIDKKALRDDEPESIWKDELIEEMGDALWYLSNICTLHGLSLNDCALHKLKEFNCLPKETNLTFSKFQEYAEQYRLQKDQDINLRRTSSLLGIISESGAVLYRYQKFVRGKLRINRISPNKIGTILWYLADIATNFQTSFANVASINVKKVSELFGELPVFQGLFDEEYPWDEQFPRNLSIYFYNYEHDDKNKKFCKLYCNNVFIGDRLDDNSLVGDGYRFHDAIHLAHMAILGWSPVLRSLLNLKRKSKPQIDNSQDGARAIIIEEAIVALNFQYAKSKDYFRDNNNISTRHLKQIKNLIQDLEVSECPMSQWKKTVIDGFKVYNQLVKKNGGLVCIDLNKRTITYSEPEAGYLENLMKNG